MEKILSRLQLIILCFFYGGVFSGSVLGIFGWYTPLTAIVMTVAIAALLLNYPLRNASASLEAEILNGRERQLPGSLKTVFYVASIGLICCLFIFPVAAWPRSVAGDWFPWDTGVYHFPKAVELFRTGNFNDMSISYNEYPVGYESLLAFGMSLTHNDGLFGPLHAFINIFFVLTLWLLIIRYTKIPSSLALFLIVLMLTSGTFVRGANIWQVFRLEMQTVGKNDLFLAAAALSVAAFFPLTRDGRMIEHLLWPFSLSIMLAISIKPNGVIISMLVWGYFLISVVKSGKRSAESWKQLLASFILIVPGGLWALRNQIFLGSVFSSGVMEGSANSIVSNLTNPDFINHVPPQLWLIGATAFIVFFLGFVQPGKFGWHAMMCAVLIVGFILTPYVLVFETKETPVQVNMRFAEALIAYLFVMALVILERPINAVLEIFLRTNGLKALASMLFVIGVVGMLYVHRGVLRLKPENDIIRRDQYRQAVGINGYYSAYDYVQRNIRDSVVWVENGLPYYIYGPGYTNTPSRQTKPDYILVVKTDWFGMGGIEAPRYFPEDWRETYTILYEDPHGIVVKR